MVFQKFCQIKEKLFSLGNLDAKRDWGHARDFVDGIWRIMQYHKPDDFVLATGKTFSVREFVNLAFFYAGIKIKWIGKGIKERGIDIKK